MKKFLLITVLLCISCNTSPSVSKEEVMDLFDEFFVALDNDPESLKNYVTDDYFIFEVSRKWSTDEFIEFVKSFGKFESKREFRNIVIDTDVNSAHISLEHDGEFILENPTPDGQVKLNYKWLESAYIVRDNGKLKFKFYFSEQIND